MLSGCLHPLFSEQRGTDQLDWQTVQYDIANSLAVIWLMCYLDKERDQEAFQGGSVVKNPPANAGDSGSILGSGRSPGVGNGNPFQYSCLGNPMNRSLVSYSPPGCKKLDTIEWLSTHAHTHQGEEEGDQDKDVKELQMMANLHIRTGYQDEKYSWRMTAKQR